MQIKISLTLAYPMKWVTESQEHKIPNQVYILCSFGSDLKWISPFPGFWGRRGFPRVPCSAVPSRHGQRRGQRWGRGRGWWEWRLDVQCPGGAAGWQGQGQVWRHSQAGPLQGQGEWGELRWLFGARPLGLKSAVLPFVF